MSSYPEITQKPLIHNCVQHLQRNQWNTLEPRNWQKRTRVWCRSSKMGNKWFALQGVFISHWTGSCMALLSFPKTPSFADKNWLALNQRNFGDCRSCVVLAGKIWDASSSLISCYHRMISFRTKGLQWSCFNFNSTSTHLPEQRVGKNNLHLRWAREYECSVNLPQVQLDFYNKLTLRGWPGQRLRWGHPYWFRQEHNKEEPNGNLVIVCTSFIVLTLPRTWRHLRDLIHSQSL